MDMQQPQIQVNRLISTTTTTALKLNNESVKFFCKCTIYSLSFGYLQPNGSAPTVVFTTV